MYMENTLNAQKVEYLGEFETKIEHIFRRLLGTQQGPFGQTIVNKKKTSCKCTCKHHL
jgi:hypothetical protein